MVLGPLQYVLLELSLESVLTYLFQYILVDFLLDHRQAWCRIILGISVVININIFFDED